jgi:uridine kinase
MNQAIIELIKSNEKRPLLVALDGRSGSGKSTLAEKLATHFDASIIVGDNFYRGGTLDEWREATPEDKWSNCIDWQRMRREAIEPLLEGKNSKWKTFNWETFEGLSDQPISVNAKEIIILEGAYSTRPELRDLIDISILVRCDETQRRERLIKRDGEESAFPWHSVWDEAEEKYFESDLQRFDLIVNT